MKKLSKFIFVGLIGLITTTCETTITQSNEQDEELQGTLIKNTFSSENADIIVTVLGSGTPVPSQTQFGPAILIQVNGKTFMFDCGRGCSSRLGQVDPKSIKDVEALSVTHLHSDHVMGIADLWLNGWAQGRNAAMEVWGPTGTTNMMEGLRQAYSYDINVRHTSGLPATQDGIAAAFTDVDSDEIIYDQDGVAVTAFQVDHGLVDPAFGYRVGYNGRSVVISGDTSPTENLYKYGDKSDVFLHEVMSPALIKYLQVNFAKHAEKIVNHHTTAEQAADIFAKTNPRLAVYYHTKNDGHFAKSLIEETRKTYSGPLEISSDLFQISVGDQIETRKILQHSD